jgi:pimeloyl-ACP methyl ester carboxylesterase
LTDAIAAAGGTLIVLVHGLGMNDQQWRDAEGSDFGDRLERDLGGFAVRLRYNSGRSIAANGEDFAELLQSIHAISAEKLHRIVLIGHSMGGLVCRSACVDAARREQPWLAALSDVVCLGSPHRGAPLERFGDSLSALLAATPYTRGLAELAEARSSGVKDLRHGQFQPPTPAIHAVTLPAHIRWFLGAAVLSARSEGVRASLLGDGLVPLRSALAQTTRSQRTPLLPPAQRRVFHRLGHLDLVSHPQVYAQLRRWLAGDSR